MAKATIFYSWQADLPSAANRSFIQQALEAALKQIGRDPTNDLEPVIDRDTLGLSGSPNIRDAIFSKIDAATGFVADVTPISASEAGKKTPNPNVLIELGYAVRALGWDCIVLVLNTALGSPEELPFDLRQQRTLTYRSAPEATERAVERALLASQLKEAMLAILGRTPRKSFELTVTSRLDKRGPNFAVYALEVAFSNLSSVAVSDWRINLDLPTRVIFQNQNSLRYSKRNPESNSVIYFEQADHTGPALQPGATVRKEVFFFMGDRFLEDSDLRTQDVVATAFVHGKVADECARRFWDLQNYQPMFNIPK